MKRQARPVVPSLPRGLAALGLVAALAADAAATDPPIPAPGQALPPHAAGGWPTALTDDEKKPARTPEQQANLDSVAGELKRIANTHGPDSVVLQSKLMIRSMGAGAVGPVEVKVAGPSSAAGADHLEIDVETGIYFDEKTTTLESRREKIWTDVAQPVLDEMVSFKIEPASLELVFLYDVQPAVGGSEVATFDPTGPSSHEAFRVRMSSTVLDDLVSDEIAAEAMREKVVFTQDAAVPRNAPTTTP